jgi:transposase InsO family protein
MIYPVVRELAAQELPVALCCRLLGVSSSGFYEWRGRAPSPRERADGELTAAVTEIHRIWRGAYGAPRIHAELRLGLGVRIGRKQVARLMRDAGLCGVYRRHLRGCTVRDPGADPHPDLARRVFAAADAPDRLWCMDVTQRRTGLGWVYRTVVLEAFSRRVAGWSIGDCLDNFVVESFLGALQLEPLDRQA